VPARARGATRRPTTAASRELAAAYRYSRSYYKLRHQEPRREPRQKDGLGWEMLARYRPEVVTGYLGLRQAAFNTGRGAALTPREKELVITAIEIARTKVNQPPTFHAKKAIDAGATVAEIAEVAALCILIGGMLTYQEAGKHALRAAEEYAAQLEAAKGTRRRSAAQRTRATRTTRSRAA